MPFYELRCNACSHEFSVRASISARSNQEITCPLCGSCDLDGIYKTVNIILNRNKGCDSCDGPSAAAPAHRCGGGCGCGH